jgi:UDP-arabinose 4-epimerase
MTPAAVLVTGGAGYIGSHTCKALAAAGYRPIAFDNLSLGHRWAVRWGPLTEADLLDGAAIAAALREHQVTAVIHFAASAYVGDSMRDPAAYYRNNVLTTLRLLDAMRTADVKNLIFSSSCSVYGNPTRIPIDETHPTTPLSPYAQTKLDCENALRWFGLAYGLRWIGLRYFNAAGADPQGEIGEEHEPETRLIPRAILAAMAKGPPLQIFGTDYATEDGTAIRDYVHVSDVAEAHVLALKRLERGLAAQILNLGTGRGLSVREVIDAVTAVAGRPVPVQQAARRAGDPAKVVADATRARSMLQWSPRYSSIETIVQTAWQWHQRRLLQPHMPDLARRTDERDGGPGSGPPSPTNAQ